MLNPNVIDDHIETIANFLAQYSEEEIILQYQRQTNLTPDIVFILLTAGKLLYKARERNENKI
jgi:hypothetical protein